MTIANEIRKLTRTIKLQQRTLENLETMEFCDSGKTIALTQQILCNMKLRLSSLESRQLVVSAK